MRVFTSAWKVCKQRACFALLEHIASRVKVAVIGLHTHVRTRTRHREPLWPRVARRCAVMERLTGPWGVTARVSCVTGSSGAPAKRPRPGAGRLLASG